MQAPQHLGKAVLLMVSDNVGSITMLHALAGGVLHIMFTLSFLLDNKRLWFWAEQYNRSHGYFPSTGDFQA
jgi:pantothenate kinase